ncbi:hypothetical protein CBL_10857 [Carabus blaptoides fortunei]
MAYILLQGSSEKPMYAVAQENSTLAAATPTLRSSGDMRYVTWVHITRSSNSNLDSFVQCTTQTPARPAYQLTPRAHGLCQQHRWHFALGDVTAAISSHGIAH